MKLNKIFLLAGIAALGLFTSCSDDDDYTKGKPASGDQLQTVTFGADNYESIELDPADATTKTFTLYRDSAYIENETTVPIKVVTNTDDVFVVPSEATFAAGSAATDITVTFDSAQIGVQYSLEIAVDDKYVNPYSQDTYKTYSYNIQRVKWNSIGFGYWCDEFWYGDLFEVEVFQRDDQKNVYRIESPYTDEYLEEYWDYYEYEDDERVYGTYQKWLVFTIKNDFVTWDDFTFNTYHTGYGAEIWALYYSNNAKNCVVVRNEDEEAAIRYLAINPRFYMYGVGGWNSYYCYLVFPDQLLPDWYYGDDDDDENEE